MAGSVGGYSNSTGSHGFLLIIPEPITLALLALACGRTIRRGKVLGQSGHLAIEPSLAPAMAAINRLGQASGAWAPSTDIPTPRA